MNKFDLSLYLITDGAGKTEAGFLQTIRQACEGGVSLVQLREKEKTALEYFELALKVKRVTDDYGVPLIIDDRADIAAAADAAGVHVGQADLPVFAARKILGPGKIVGATAKTVSQAKKAKKEGADYLGVGAIFPTTTKVITVITEVATLNEIGRETGIPIAAIGGLNSSNIHVLYDSAALGIGVVTAIMKSENPRVTAEALKKQVLENFVSRRW